MTCKTMKKLVRLLEQGEGSGEDRSGGATRPRKVFTSVQKGPILDEASRKESGPLILLMMLAWKKGDRITSRQGICPIEGRRKLLKMAEACIRGRRALARS